MSYEGLPILRPTEVVRLLERLGFVRLRKSGSGHLRFGHADGRKTTVPMHRGKTIGRGLLRKILRDLNLTPDELRRLL